MDDEADPVPGRPDVPAGDCAVGVTDLDEAVRALAHRARRTILVLTWREQQLAGQIADRLDLAPATVSEHLKVLRKTGLLHLERRGTQWRYHADPARVRAVLDALHADLTPDPEEPDMTHPIAHFDIAGPDHAALTAFYGGLLDWTIQPTGPGYALAETGSVRGALVEAESPGVTLGVTVPDLDAALVRAVELGGSVEMPATNNGWVTKALVRDPAGNAVSLIQG